MNFQIDPYVRLKWEPWLQGNDRYEGFYIDVLQEVAERAKMDFQLRLVADGQIGTKGDDNSWNGMMGELLEGVIMIITLLVTEEMYSLYRW